MEKKEQEKTLFTIQIPPDTPGSPVVGPDGELKSEKFDKHLTKNEFNHFLVANLDSVGKVMVGMIKQIEANRKEIEELKDRLNK